MNITVYLGATTPKNEIYAKKIVELGQWIAHNNHTLIYGGSKVGLMGLLADTVLKNDGHVIGVEPQFFVDNFLQVENLDELIITKTMAERKVKMMELGDVFIAFPGGTGTMEEISEVISMNQIGQMSKPYFYYNLNGFYEPMKQMYEKMVSEGFLRHECLENIRFADTLEDIFAQINE